MHLGGGGDQGIEVVGGSSGFLCLDHEFSALDGDGRGHEQDARLEVRNDVELEPVDDGIPLLPYWHHEDAGLYFGEADNAEEHDAGIPSREPIHDRGERCGLR